MDQFDAKNHWENIYKTKELTDVSWYQSVPKISLDYVKNFNLPLSFKIIDVGGGDSFFVDHLLTLGYEQITVLDISTTAVEKAKLRLGEKAKLVNWIVADISTFESTEIYDFWHDRAVFHFQTEKIQIDHYKLVVARSVKENGFLVIGTFSENGPLKCSGIEIKQYSQTDLSTCFESDFDKISCMNVDHETPFQTIQNFTFCCFRRKTK